jgi:primosomal protein N' (replication factor Y)
LLQIKLKHRDFEKLREGSIWLYSVLKQQITIPILGPEEPAVNRIRNEYIRTILVKIPNNANLNGTKKIIKKALVSFEATSQYRAIKTTINVDY